MAMLIDRAVARSSTSGYVRREPVLEYAPTRGDAWGEPDAQKTPPTWLGAFPLSTAHRCAAKCGAPATTRAVWIYRGDLLLLVLCAACCVVARERSDDRNNVRLAAAPPPLLPVEKRSSRPTDPTKPRINGWKRKP